VAIWVAIASHSSHCRQQAQGCGDRWCHSREGQVRREREHGAVAVVRASVFLAC
jgi:hypothetical protein